MRYHLAMAKDTRYSLLAKRLRQLFLRRHEWDIRNLRFTHSLMPEMVGELENPLGHPLREKPACKAKPASRFRKLGLNSRTNNE